MDWNSPGVEPLRALVIQIQKEKENFIVVCLRPAWNVKLGSYMS